MRIHGRNGIVYLSQSNGGVASPLAFQSDWSMSFGVARNGITPIGDRGQTYVDQLPDVTGDFTGIYDDVTSQTYLAAIDGLPRNFYLYPDATRPYKFFYGTILPDFTAAAGVAAGAVVKATWSPSGQILKSPLGPVVTLLGQDGTFGTLTAARFTATGHTIAVHPVPGWQFGAGLAIFYTRATPDGQLILTTLPLTDNELKPTMDHAEICTYNPATDTFSRQVIPTSTGALTAVNPANGLGGTDVGAGDCVIVVIGGTSYVLLTCDGYYFSWNIPTFGLYPALAFLQLAGGAWAYDAGISLTGDQWEATNPTAYATIAPAGQTAGVGANYWPTRSANQMAVLPQSGRVVVGHYFGTGAVTSGAISVSDSSGNMLASYQVPNITPASGGPVVLIAVRDVEADPSSALNDERFVVVYDQFPGTIQRCFQEFSYNESTKVIAPVTMPTCPADTRAAGAVPANLDPTYAWFAPAGGRDAGTLYVSCTNGLGSANLSAYAQHAGVRTNVAEAPVAGGWQSTAWPTPCKPDYSLGFPVAQGIGGLAGPMATDPVTGALLVPGVGGRLGITIPDAAPSLGPNLLSAFASGFEPTNALSADDATFATSLGTWATFVGTVARVTSPPVAPPAGTAAGKITQPFSSGNNAAHNGVTTYAVVGSKPYQFDTWFLANSTGRTCEAWIRWITSGGATISDSAHTTVTDNTTTWTKARVVATSPSNAAFAQLWIQTDVPANGEAHFWAANDLFSLDASATGWTTFLTNVQLTSDQALDGSFSLQMSAPFNAETLSAISPQVAVVPGNEYLAKASFRAKTVPQSCTVFLRWFTAGGASAGADTAGTLVATDSTSGWTVEAWCGGMAPAGAAFASVILAPVTSTTNEFHYADRVSIQRQPYTPASFVDYDLTGLRAVYPAQTLGIGRPSIIGRTLYIPVAVLFGAAENTAYGAGGYVPAAKPQFVAAIDLLQLLGQ